MHGHPLVVVILTFNSDKAIAETVSQAKKLSDDIFVIDSGSTDETLRLLAENGCRVVQREFKNYSEQRNWAISQISPSTSWQLHLDADEVLDDLAVAEISRTIVGPEGADGYLLLRKTYFMGRLLRFGGCETWHLRLFKTGAGKCENRLYDQHFICAGRVEKLRGALHDKNVSSLNEWVARHNRWSDLEARQVVLGGEVRSDMLVPNFLGDSRERKRSLKATYYGLPRDVRAIGYFVYRYFLRLGFLDGRVGLYYAVFQALWFRLMVDAKIVELEAALSPGTAQTTALK